MGTRVCGSMVRTESLKVSALKNPCSHESPVLLLPRSHATGFLLHRNTRLIHELRLHFCTSLLV